MSILNVNKINPVGGGSTVTIAGIASVTNNISVGNSVTATTFHGSGANLTNLPAAQLTGTLPAISGANLTGLTSPAISAIASDGANRVLTSDGDGTATAHSFVTIENNRLSVNRGSGSGSFPLIVRRTDASGIIAEFANSSGYGLLIGQNSATGEAYLRTGTGQPMVFTTNAGSGIANERMRLTTNANGTGAMYINQTTEVSGANSHLVVNNSVAIVSGSTFRSFYMSGNGNAYFWNGSNQPYISSSGNFTNASDISLKKDITDLTYGIDVLKNLKPRKYKMKADDKEQIGFIAQEVETAVPEVVDASETPNGDQHKGLAYGNLTAVLTKALQEAVTKIETLEAKVAALEGS